MKQSILVLFLFCVSLLSWAGMVDISLGQEMHQNPDGKFHVIAFFQKQITPEETIESWGIRGDEISSRIQVANAYKITAEESYFWFKQFCSQYPDVQGLVLHELLQAASFTATPKTIFAIAKHPEIGRVSLYKAENTKPNEFFLQPEYFQVQSLEVVRYGDDTETAPQTEVIPVESREITPEQIINILKKIYDFVKENKPVVNTSIDQAAAVPQGINSWQQMAGWREKHTGQYTILYKNLYGMEVVKIVVRVHFYHSGNYNNVGKYITCATVSIDEMNVMWGYTLNATVKIPDSGIVNIGTNQNPVAGMKMFVNWVVTTILQHQEGTLTFSLDGNGNISGY